MAEIFLSSSSDAGDEEKHRNEALVPALVFIGLAIFCCIGCIVCCNYVKKESDDHFEMVKSQRQDFLLKQRTLISMKETHDDFVDIDAGNAYNMLQSQ